MSDAAWPRDRERAGTCDHCGSTEKPVVTFRADVTSCEDCFDGFVEVEREEVPASSEARSWRCERCGLHKTKTDESAALGCGACGGKLVTAEACCATCGRMVEVFNHPDHGLVLMARRVNETHAPGDAWCDGGGRRP